jgi:hypothetical protein
LHQGANAPPFDITFGKVMSIRDHPLFLNSLLKHFRKKNENVVQDERYTLHDTEGNSLYLHSFEYYRSEFIEFLRKGAGSIEIPDLDRGRMFYTLEFIQDQWVLSKTAIDLNGWIAMYTECLIITHPDDLVPVIDEIVPTDDDM